MIYLFFFLQLATAQTVKLEVGRSQVTRNEFQIPTSSGTEVSFPDSAQFYYRIEGQWDWNEKNGVRVVVAPFSYKETISTSTPLLFDQQTFAANTPTRLEFKFNSYRLGYVRHVFQNSDFDLDLGITLKMRDALISVSQNAQEEKFTDFGFVPLFYVAGKYKWSDLSSLVFNCDGAGSSQGYAVDALLEWQYHIKPTHSLALGYRFLDGGADNDKVKNFATVQYLNASFYYHF